MIIRIDRFLYNRQEDCKMKYGAIMKYLALPCATLLLAGCAGSGPAPQTYDGLELVPDTRFGEVYMRPGVDLSSYDSYGIEACEVAFRKNWQRDQNSSRLDLGNRVTQQDVDRIKDALGAACDKYFRGALEQAPPYRLVESFGNGEPVLVLRPAIINLDIAAPDVKSAGMQRVYTTEAGQMTLLLEALDGTTGEILLRIIDRQRGRDYGRLQWTNSVTNQADARRILTRWAGQLRKGLDEVAVSSRAGN